jgi:hypothetical protein
LLAEMRPAYTGRGDRSVRLLYLTLALFGAAACLAVVYAFGLLAMMPSGGRGSMQVLFPLGVFALALAAGQMLIAALMNPRRAATRRLLTSGVLLWFGTVVLLSVVAYAGPASDMTLGGMVQIMGMLGMFALLPLAALVLAWWHFPAA